MKLKTKIGNGPRRFFWASLLSKTNFHKDWQFFFWWWWKWLWKFSGLEVNWLTIWFYEELLGNFIFCFTCILGLSQFEAWKPITVQNGWNEYCWNVNLTPLLYQKVNWNQLKWLIPHDRTWKVPLLPFKIFWGLLGYGTVWGLV